MTRLLTISGTLMYAVGLGGLIVIVVLSIATQVSRNMESATTTASAVERAPLPGAREAGRSKIGPHAGAANIAAMEGLGVRDFGEPSPIAPPPRPITKLRMPRIRLEADVVAAPFVERAGDGTWHDSRRGTRNLARAPERWGTPSSWGISPA